MTAYREPEEWAEKYGGPSRVEGTTEGEAS